MLCKMGVTCQASQQQPDHIHGLLLPTQASLSVEEGLGSLDFCHCDKILQKSNCREKRLALIQDLLSFSGVVGLRIWAVMVQSTLT